MRLGRATAFFFLASSLFVTASCGDDNNQTPDGGVCPGGCGSNAVCSAEDICVCLPGTTGNPMSACVPDCSGIACTNGVCSLGEEGVFCDCQVGWEGAACDAPVNGCETATRCMNGGTCVSTGPGSYQCDCLPGFTGSTCQTEAMGCAARPCQNGSCSGTSPSYVCECERGWTGTECHAVASSCPPMSNPDPCQNGAICADANALGGGADYTCSTGCLNHLGYECEVPNTASACGAYVDVVYKIAGTFRVANTPLNAGNVSRPVGVNTTDPQYAHDGVTSPFPATDFTQGYVRLRFQNSATGSDPGVPGPGPVQVIEWYLPIEFDVTGAAIPTVRTNVDHSAGLVALTGRYVDYQQVLSRPCRAVADGTVTGTTLDWAACGVTPTGNTMFRNDAAQAPVSNDSGCLRRTSNTGNARCIAGSCGLVPNVTVGDLRGTWDQPLNDFVFSSTDYASATFSMEEIQIPNDTGTTTWLTIDTATPIFTECSTTPTCDELCDADSCQVPD